jgi:glycosyltransferase involved in cell wall biosynthesis
MANTICFLSLKHDFDDNRIYHKEACTLARSGYKVIHVAPGMGTSCFLRGVWIEFYPPASGKLAMLRNALRLLRIGIHIDADYYHCNEMESWLIGCFIKLCNSHKKVIFDVHEHYPSRFNEPHFPKWLGVFGSPVIRILIKCLTPFTDHLIYAKRSVASDFKHAEQKSTFLFNYAPLRLQSRDKDNVPDSVQKHFDGYPVAVHIGVLSRARGWPQMLQALSLMKNKTLKVICIGSVREGKATVMSEAERLGVADRVLLIDSMPYDSMFDYLLLSNVGLMLYQPGILNHVFAFPIKMYDYMLAGLPVLGPNFAIEAAPVIKEEKCGLLVDTNRPEQIAQALDFFCENPAQAKEMGLRGRKAIVQRYNWEAEEDKLIDVYHTLTMS